MTSTRAQSQSVLSSPPAVTAVNDYEGLSYCLESTTNVVTFFSDGSPTLTVPGSGLLASLIVTRDSTRYLVVSGFDANERGKLYRYHDDTGDGIPDESTETLLLDLGATPIWATSFDVLDDGTTYLLDARCQDIVLAKDTDSDTWPDSLETTPFAMSDTFEVLLDVGAIVVEGEGDVRGSLSYGSQSDLILGGATALVTRFQDTDGDNVADSGALDVQEFPKLRVLGTPGAGHQDVLASATAGQTAAVWSLDADLNPSVLLGSIVTASEDWTTVPLSRALNLDEWILVRLEGSPGNAVRSRVWSARAQVFESSPTVVDITGGAVEIRGLDFASTMDVTLVTEDEVERSLSFVVQNDTTATVTVPALPASAEGAATLVVEDPSVPDETTAIEIHIYVPESGS